MKREDVKVVAVCCGSRVLARQVEHILEKVRVGKEVQPPKQDRGFRIGGLGGLVADLEKLVIVLVGAGPKERPVLFVPHLPDLDPGLEMGDGLVHEPSPVVVGVIPGQIEVGGWGGAGAGLAKGLDRPRLLFDLGLDGRAEGGAFCRRPVGGSHQDGADRHAGGQVCVDAGVKGAPVEVSLGGLDLVPAQLPAVQRRTGLAGQVVPHLLVVVHKAEAQRALLCRDRGACRAAGRSHQEQCEHGRGDQELAHRRFPPRNGVCLVYHTWPGIPNGWPRHGGSRCGEIAASGVNRADMCTGHQAARAARGQNGYPLLKQCQSQRRQAVIIAVD